MKKGNIIFLNILVVILSVYTGYYFGKRGYEVEVQRHPISFSIENKTPDFEINADFAQFWEVWDTVNKKHIEKPLDGQKLVQGAIKGMVKSIEDPYTIYLEPRENTSSDEILRGEYEGIGAELTMRDDIVTVVSPFDSSPAKEAGVRPGDQIIAVDEETTIGEDLFDVVERIKGPAGTNVTLTVARKDREPFDIEIERGEISLDTVQYEMKSDTTAYIRISRFGEKTNSEWDETVREIILNNPSTENIILDLRGNPGGYLNSAVHVASEFISRGVVVKEEFYDGTVRNINVDHEGSFIGKNLIILIDEGSASASEIMAGALKERADAVLVGATSFGKGTVQEPIDYPNGAGLNITIAKWLTPEGYWVHEQGLEPGEVVELSEEDIENDNDRQLERALELVE